VVGLPKLNFEADGKHLATETETFMADLRQSSLRKLRTPRYYLNRRKCTNELEAFTP